MRRPPEDLAVAHGRGRPGQGPAGVDRVEEQALGLRGQDHRFEDRLGEHTLARPGLVCTQPRGLRIRSLPGQLGNQTCHDLGWLRHGRAVHAEDPFGP